MTSPIPDRAPVSAIALWHRVLSPTNQALSALAADDTDWVRPAVVAPWVNYAGTGSLWGTFGYRRRRGIVWIDGIVKSGTPGVASPIYTLPPGFRPKANAIFSCVAENPGTTEGAARVDVRSDGTVAVLGYAFGGTNAYVILTGIRFLAEQ